MTPSEINAALREASEAEQRELRNPLEVVGEIKQRWHEARMSIIAKCDHSGSVDYRSVCTTCGKVVGE